MNIVLRRGRERLSGQLAVRAFQTQGLYVANTASIVSWPQRCVSGPLPRYGTCNITLQCVYMPFSTHAIREMLMACCLHAGLMPKDSVYRWCEDGATHSSRDLPACTARELQKYLPIEIAWGSGVRAKAKLLSTGRCVRVHCAMLAVYHHAHTPFCLIYRSPMLFAGLTAAPRLINGDMSSRARPLQTLWSGGWRCRCATPSSWWSLG